MGHTFGAGTTFFWRTLLSSPLALTQSGGQVKPRLVSYAIMYHSNTTHIASLGAHHTPAESTASRSLYVVCRYDRST